MRLVVKRESEFYDSNQVNLLQGLSTYSKLNI